MEIIQLEENFKFLVNYLNKISTNNFIKYCVLFTNSTKRKYPINYQNYISLNTDISEENKQ